MPIFYERWRFGPLLDMPRSVPLILMVAIAAPALAGCLSDPTPEVLATFYPLAFLAETIAGGAVSVGLAVPEGTEPHDWEPTLRDATRLSEAKLVLAQGSAFETWLPGLLDSLGNSALTVVYTGHDLRQGNGTHDSENATADDEHDDEHGHDGDPHTWLDPLLFAEQAERVEDALTFAFPQYAETFAANADLLATRLAVLHAAYATGLADCETRVFVMQHAAFGHLAARYDLEAHAVTGIHPEAEPSPAELSASIDVVRDNNLTVVFAEELLSAGIMSSIARETGADVRILTPLEGRMPADRRADADYIDLATRNLHELEAALRCT